MLILRSVDYQVQLFVARLFGDFDSKIGGAMVQILLRRFVTVVVFDFAVKVFRHRLDDDHRVPTGRRALPGSGFERERSIPLDHGSRSNHWLGLGTEFNGAKTGNRVVLLEFYYALNPMVRATAISAACQKE